MHFVTECARSVFDRGREDHLRGHVHAGLNWKRVADLARRHGLLPLVQCHAMQLVDADATVPDSFRRQFEAAGAFNVLQTGELLRLIKFLNGAGVDVMPLKGPALAQQLYGSVALRQFIDLDILVRRRDVWMASELLESQGFVADLAVPREKRAAFVASDYVRRFTRDGGRTVIELHWGIARSWFGVLFDVDAIFNRAGRMALQGAQVLTPSAEDLVQILCVHATRHGWDKLEAVASLAALARREPIDWVRVRRTSAAMHCQRLVDFGMLLAHLLFEVDLPPQFAHTVNSRKLVSLASRIATRCWPHQNGASITVAGQFVVHLRLKDTFADQIRYCVGVFAPTADDWTATRLQGPLSVAYPALRAFKLLRKYGPVDLTPRPLRSVD